MRSIKIITISVLTIICYLTVLNSLIILPEAMLRESSPNYERSIDLTKSLPEDKLKGMEKTPHANFVFHSMEALDGARMFEDLAQLYERWEIDSVSIYVGDSNDLVKLVSNDSPLYEYVSQVKSKGFGIDYSYSESSNQIEFFGKDPLEPYFYMGMNGISKTKEGAGVFNEAICFKTIRYKMSKTDSIQLLVGYSQKENCFYKVDIFQNQIMKSESLPANLEILDFGFAVDDYSSSFSRWRLPIRLIPPLRLWEDGDEYYAVEGETKYSAIFMFEEAQADSNKIVTVDSFGNIRLFDIESMLFDPKVLATIYPAKGFYAPSKLELCDTPLWTAVPVFAPGGEYCGMLTNTVDRQGYVCQGRFFDKDGKLVDQTRLSYSNVILKTMIMDESLGTLGFICKYVLESVRPLILEVADYFVAPKLSAANYNKGFFFSQLSYTAILGMSGDYDAILFFIALSLLLHVWLAIAARKTINCIGITNIEKAYWIVFILAFGIPAFITMKLCCKFEKMVTCHSCGQLRRVDFDYCQNCASDWQETESPVWRVF